MKENVMSDYYDKNIEMMLKNLDNVELSKDEARTLWFLANNEDPDTIKNISTLFRKCCDGKEL